MKLSRPTLRTLVVMLFAWLTALPSAAKHETISVEAPFAMPDIHVFQFPDRDFPITNYGAKQKGQASDRLCIAANRAAFAEAMKACNAAGGGRVVVPKGEWPTGPIHFRSQCNLYLAEGAKVVFSSDPNDYLPAVEVSWEGLECMNYSPLVYAYQCEDIAITGRGTLTPDMTTWKQWFSRPKPHMAALAKLYDWGTFGKPVAERNMTTGDDHLRPHLIHFNQCKNVLLDSFKIRQSPFWTIHLYRCEGGVARNLDVYAHGHNNDGIDLEMTQNFLVENCTFDQGDDGVVIKSGRNHDAWRIGRPTQNVVIRYCHVRNAHGLLVIGSEISGGIRNVYMHDCDVDGRVLNLFYLKTNRRRGAFLENITMERVKANDMQRAFAIDTDVLYQWKNLVPTYKDTVTAIRNITMRGVTCKTADGVVQINGDKDLPVQNVLIQDVKVDTVRKFTIEKENVQGLKLKNIKWGKYLGKAKTAR